MPRKEPTSNFSETRTKINLGKRNYKPKLEMSNVGYLMQGKANLRSKKEKLMLKDRKEKKDG